MARPPMLLDLEPSTPSLWLSAEKLRTTENLAAKHVAMKVCAGEAAIDKPNYDQALRKLTCCGLQMLGLAPCYQIKFGGQITGT